jgi:Fe-S cluster assembly protein SufD
MNSNNTSHLSKPSLSRFSFEKNKTMLTPELQENSHSSQALPWLLKIKQQAYSDLAQQKLPTRKTEHWKYNDMTFLSQFDFNVIPVSAENIITKLPKLILDDSYLCVFVNGVYNSELSSQSASSHLTITSFSAANDSQKEIIVKHLNTAKQNKNCLIQLNTAISDHGLLIEVAKNTKLDKPIYCVHINTTKNNSASANQVIINCEASSECQIIEHFISNSEESLNLQQTIIYSQANCKVDHYRLNVEESSSRQVSRLLAILENDACLNSFYYSEGSLLNKTDIDIYHQGKNSESHLTGIYLPSNEHVIDYHTNIEHQVPHCDSREVFRGIIADSAKATFSGKIHIFRDAQKSDAQLSNKNLLLTNQAEINTKPELEIYADDVICAHGATIAKIDDDAVYYLKTRGIDESSAKKMLSIGFINELLEKVSINKLNSFLQDKVQTSLSDIKT